MDPIPLRPKKVGFRCLSGESHPPGIAAQQASQKPSSIRNRERHSRPSGELRDVDWKSRVGFEMEDDGIFGVKRALNVAKGLSGVSERIQRFESCRARSGQTATSMGLRPSSRIGNGQTSGESPTRGWG